MLNTLSLLQGCNPAGVTIVKPNKPGSQKHYEEEFYLRCQRIMKWLLIWQVPHDCIKNAFLVNGIIFVRDDYLPQLHGNMRRACNYKIPERKYRTYHLKEMAKSGATFEEMYLSHFGTPARKNAQRRYYLKMLLAGNR